MKLRGRTSRPIENPFLIQSEAGPKEERGSQDRGYIVINGGHGINKAREQG